MSPEHTLHTMETSSRTCTVATGTAFLLALTELSLPVVLEASA